MRTPTPVLVEAMRVLAIEVISDDGVANAAIEEAGQRLGELHALLSAVVKQHDDVKPPYSPGHDHLRPGYWDHVNPPEIAGKPCEWCATWRKIVEEVAP